MNDLELGGLQPSLTDYQHLRPQNPFIDQQDPKNPDLSFSFFPADPGKYRLWAQLVIDGQERFVPFDLEVVDDA